MKYYLYVKQHNQTGLKYLGRTIRDPYKYKGSGTVWKQHIKKYGNDTSTHVIGIYETLEQLKENGLYYSNLWNIVESNQWANLEPESGDGRALGYIVSEEIKQKLRKPKSIPSKLKGRTYEEIYGSEKASQLKKDRAEKLQGNKNLQGFYNNRKGTNWFTNGKEDIMLLPKDQVPFGFFPGRSKNAKYMKRELIQII